jgi:hypothetical protein
MNPLLRARYRVGAISIAILSLTHIKKTSEKALDMRRIS